MTMANQANQEVNEDVGLGKKMGFFIVAMAIAAVYYYFLDWVMMGPMQNLPFPYK
jgi:hypothetical protein